MTDQESKEAWESRAACQSEPHLLLWCGQSEIGVVPMFESLSLPHEIRKRDFKAEEPRLRGDLIDVQFDLLESGDFPVIVLLSGMDILGRSAAAKQLQSWMDPRHIRPYAAMNPSDEELERPRMWRYWRVLPRKGRIGIFLNSWYEFGVVGYVSGQMTHDQFRAQIDEISRFEQLLAREGALFLKFFFVLPKKQELRLIKRIKRDRSLPWKISEEEMKIAELLDRPCREACDTNVPRFQLKSRIRDALPRILRDV